MHEKISKQLINRYSIIFMIDFLACFLIFTTHFTNYIIYIEYNRLFPDLFILYGFVIIVSALIAFTLRVKVFYAREIIFSGLIVISLSDTVFAFGTTGEGAWLGVAMIVISLALVAVFLLHQHVSKILIVVFGTMLISTIFLHTRFFQALDAEEPVVQTSITNKPVIVHLVLDEHIGMAGIKAAFPLGERHTTDLATFYLKNEFRLFGNAYSQYFDTHTSLASTFNVNAEAAPEELASRFRNKYILNKNEYFDTWAKRGYKINILQSSYLDMCSNGVSNISACVTYKHDSFDDKAISSLPMSERLKLIGNMYFSSFTLVKLLHLSLQLVDEDYSLNTVFWHGRVGPLSTVTPLERLIQDVSNSNGGDFFFAHLLMPHYPYVYRPDCSVRSPISSWKIRTGDDGKNIKSKRVAAYRDYIDQIECTMRKLQPLFDVMKTRGIFDDATIIIHGDHGARISRIPMVAKHTDVLTSNDYLDAFSILFAIKAPKFKPGIDSRMATLPNLLNYVIDSNKGVLQLEPNPYVFLSDDNEYVKTPIEPFPYP